MLLPTFIYGLHKTVQKRCEKMGKTVTSAQHYVETMLSMGMTDTAAHPEALLVLAGPYPRLAKVEAFQLYYPLSMIWRKQPAGPAFDRLIEDIFQESIKTAWGTLLLTPNPECWGYFGGEIGFGKGASSFDAARCRAFLQALFAHWDEISAIGPRFSNGVHDAAPLLERITMIQPAIGKLLHMTNEPLASTDWPALFDELRRKGDI